MFSLLDDCELVSLSEKELIKNFECQEEDLNEFFCKDALKHQKQLLGETLFFRHKEIGEIVCAFTLSNDSIKLDGLSGSIKKKVKKNIPHAKSRNAYPATLIGRFGVPKKFSGNGIGTQAMNFIKAKCIIENASKCRFILVDSYSTENALGFYRSNEFQLLFNNEEEEKKHYKKDTLKTRFMFFDLLPWVQKLNKLKR
jgi:GNAT superfamily N-acetyltransferase